MLKMTHFVSTILSLLLLSLSCVANPDGAMLVRFRNIANYDMVLWWITPYREEEIRFFGHVHGNGGMTSFTAYVGHQFFWAPPHKERDQSQRRQHFQIKADQILYLYTDDQQPADRHIVDTANEELAFLTNYYLTNGHHWLSTYQRPEPVLPFVFTNKQQTHKWVESDSYFWNCDPSNPSNAASNTNSKPNSIVNKFDRLLRNQHKCRDFNDGKPIKLQIEQLHQTQPQIYKIANFVSEFEANHLIQLSKPSMRRSTVGDGDEMRVDPTRTCTNTWLAMNRTQIVESIYQRIGDVLGIDKYKMLVRSTVKMSASEFESIEGVASHMEVIHFATNEHYSRHYDNAVNDEKYLHFVTFQVILFTSDDFEGGATGFPHAKNSDNSYGFEVKSEKYSAVFWYNLLNDGNLDETSMYSHDRVIKGDQWLLHINIWDPTLPDHGDPTMPHELVYAMHDEL